MSTHPWGTVTARYQAQRKARSDKGQSRFTPEERLRRRQASWARAEEKRVLRRALDRIFARSLARVQARLNTPTAPVVVTDDEREGGLVLTTRGSVGGFSQPMTAEYQRAER